MGSVVFRTIEAVFYAVGVVSLLSVLTLADQLASAPSAGGGAATRALADSLLSVRDNSSLVAVFAFSTGALMTTSCSCTRGWCRSRIPVNESAPTAARR